MKYSLLLLLAFVFANSALAESDLVKIPTLRLNAATVGNSRKQSPTVAPNPKADRVTVAHGSSVEITVENTGPNTENVTVRWFAVGRYETSKNFFRNGDGEKAVIVPPKSSQDFTVDCDIDSHQTKSTKSSYKSGGKLVGWVVALYDSKGKLLSSTASDTYLKEFAATPPPQQHK